MEYEELFGTGDVNGAGDIPTPEETREWIARVNAVLARPAPEHPEDDGLEYSASLVVQHQRWLDEQRARAAA